MTDLKDLVKLKKNRIIVEGLNMGIFSLLVIIVLLGGCVSKSFEKHKETVISNIEQQWRYSKEQSLSHFNSDISSVICSEEIDVYDNSELKAIIKDEFNTIPITNVDYIRCIAHGYSINKTTYTDISGIDTHNLDDMINTHVIKTNTELIEQISSACLSKYGSVTEEYINLYKNLIDKYMIKNDVLYETGGQPFNSSIDEIRTELDKLLDYNTLSSDETITLSNGKTYWVEVTSIPPNGNGFGDEGYYEYSGMNHLYKSIKVAMIVDSEQVISQVIDFTVIDNLQTSLNIFLIINFIICVVVMIYIFYKKIVKM